MRIRRKPPTLVSMWMLDVFCCALGCVIMLWVLESLSSTEQSRKAKNAMLDLGKTRTELVATRDEFTNARKQLNSTIEDLRGQLAAMLAESDAQELALIRANAETADTKKALAVATTDLDSTQADFAKATAKLQKLLDELVRKDKSTDAIRTELATAKASEVNLQKLLRSQEQLASALETAKKAADIKLSDLDAKYLGLQKEAKGLVEARSMATKATDTAAVQKRELAELRKQLDDSNASIIDLQGDKKKLADKFDKLRVENDGRFAGIAMTGRRVVFIVDISGSMKLLDEKTPDANKWPTVVETVGKVMRSLPSLDQFQVVIFSRTARHLFDTKEWIPYRGEASVKQVTDALTDTLVGSDTNLYTAFDLAFKFRDTGLDTVYLFSNGLPTSGPGLTAEQDKYFNDNQRVDALAKYLRTTLKTTWNTARTKVKINSIGFFYESPEVGAFLWALSRENDGSFVGMSKP